MSKARDLADFVAAGGQLADGVINVAEIGDLTATAAELNALDGITATVTELNKLDGYTGAVADLNRLDVTTEGTSEASKVVTANSSGVVTLGGTLSLADNVLSRPVLEDYAIQGSAIGNTGSAQTFDLSSANFFSATLDQASTFTFSNPPASGDFGGFVLELTNGGAFTITYPSSVDFVGGTAPTLTAAGVDQLVFTTRDGGTTYFGFVAGLDIKSPA
tara:strand:- start:109 stop:762 length:654 start_codon:yes stop_codon:yes gene_type:complete